MAIPAPSSCTIIGDPDLYGLGVRLAVYAQALTYLCATTYSKSPRMILEIPCLLLNISVNSVLVLRAIQGHLRPFDTMLALFTAGTLGVAAPLEEYEEWERRGMTVGGKVVTWLQAACMAIQLGFGSWAVMNDLKVDIRSDQDNCPVWIYVFSKQRNSGWGLKCWKGYYGLSVGFLTLRWMWRQDVLRSAVYAVWQWTRNIVLEFRERLFVPKQKASEIKLKNPSQTASTNTASPIPVSSIKSPPLSYSPVTRIPLDPQAHQTVITPRIAVQKSEQTVQYFPSKQSSLRPETPILFMSFFWTICFNVLGGELMIYWNRVQGVNSLNSSGQVLSLLGGTFTLAQFIWAVSGLSMG